MQEISCDCLLCEIGTGSGVRGEASSGAREEDRLEVGGLCEEGVARWLGVAGQRAEAKKEKRERELSKQHVCFWKENGLRKIFP